MREEHLPQEGKIITQRCTVKDTCIRGNTGRDDADGMCKEERDKGTERANEGTQYQLSISNENNTTRWSKDGQGLRGHPRHCGCARICRRPRRRGLGHTRFTARWGVSQRVRGRRHRRCCRPGTHVAWLVSFGEGNSLLAITGVSEVK